MLFMNIADCSNNSQEKINVLVVDADYMSREKISGILSRHENIGSVTQASSCANALRFLHNLTPDLAFIDAGSYPLNRGKSENQLKSFAIFVVILLNDGELCVEEIQKKYEQYVCVEKRHLTDMIDIFLDSFYRNRKEIAAMSSCDL